MMAAFLIGVGLAFYLTFMEPVNVQAEITMQKRKALRLVDNYQNYPNESQDKARNLSTAKLANNTLSNRQASNLIMEEFPRFNRTSEEIATIQLQLWETALPDKAFTIYLAIAAK